MSGDDGGEVPHKREACPARQSGLVSELGWYPVQRNDERNEGPHQEAKGISSGSFIVKLSLGRCSTAKQSLSVVDEFYLAVD